MGTKTKQRKTKRERQRRRGDLEVKTLGLQKEKKRNGKERVFQSGSAELAFFERRKASGVEWEREGKERRDGGWGEEKTTYSVLLLLIQNPISSGFEVLQQQKANETRFSLQPRTEPNRTRN